MPGGCFTARGYVGKALKRRHEKGGDMMEDMPEIKFSKHYKKLPPDANGKLATLLDVHKIMLQRQSEWFLKYDTEAQDGSIYELPKQGEYLFLLFELEDGGLFTTLRRSTPPKDAYYNRLKGKFLKVVITDVPQ